MLKKSLSYAAVFMAGTILSGGVVFAATTYVQAQKESTTVSLNGQTVEKPPALVYGGTTYVQLYSIQQALNKAGIANTWNGSNFNMNANTATSTSTSTSTGDTTVSGANMISAPTMFNYNVNTADGVTLTWLANYSGNKTVNYYTVNISTYNPVGDPSLDEMTGKSKFSLKYVGPVKPGDQLAVFKLFTYQGALSTIVIDSVVLQFSDGTTETVKYGYKTSDSSGFAN